MCEGEKEEERGRSKDHMTEGGCGVVCGGGGVIKEQQEGMVWW